MWKRNIILVLALAYLAFSIYGSLVPLNFSPHPVSQAWGTFKNIRYLNLGIGSRADWVANILLFIPLSFLWLGTLWRDNGFAGKLVASTATFIICAFLSVAIEFTQLFFPPRTVSLNDILAESLGAFIGIALWWVKGPETVRRIRHFIERHDNTSEHLLWIYLFILFGYNVLPLDLTISPVELYHEWKQGKIILLPFSAHTSGVAEFLYDLLSDVVIWIPVTFLLIMSARKSPRQAWLWTVAAAALLEFIQLFVYSRVTDIGDILTAMAGAGAGVLAAKYIIKPPQSSYSKSYNRTLILGILGTLAWSLVLVGVFWYPYDFHFERNFLRERIPELFQVPFFKYYYGTEFRAITEVIHKTAFFLPLGVTLAYSRSAIQNPVVRDYFKMGAIIFIIGVAMGIEIGQIALPDKNPDNTDLALEAISGIIGLYGFPYLSNRLRQNRKQPIERQ